MNHPPTLYHCANCNKPLLAKTINKKPVDPENLFCLKCGPAIRAMRKVGRA